MSSAPVASNSDKTFTSTPATSLSTATTYKIRITTTVTDTSSNSLTSAYTTNGFTTTSSASGDVTRPTIASVNPADNTTYNSPASTIAVIFSEAMSTGTITTNTSDTTCSGSFQLSADNFTSCIKMSATPAATNSDMTFTATPSDNLSGGATYKLQITTSATDTSSNSLASAQTSNGFTTTPSGSGTIKGSVKLDNGSALSGVSVSYAIYGSTADNATSDSSGDFSKSLGGLGIYTLTYRKSGYIDATQTATLSTDNQTLVVATLTQLSSSCSAGTVAGNITDSVSSSIVSGVSLSVRSGVNVTSGSTTGVTATTDSSGDYTLSSMAAGWYTVQTDKSGYTDGYFNVKSCSGVTGQDSAITTTLSSGTMRIVLSWPTGSTAADLDSHLQIPDNASGQKHIYYPTANKTFYYATNTNTCGSCSISQLSDNVTLDRDDSDGAPGTETTTVTIVRSGTYSYRVHDYTNKSNSSSTKLATSGANVKAYYNDTTTTYSVPNIAGNVWGVFTFDYASGSFTASDNMSSSTSASGVF